MQGVSLRVPAGTSCAIVGTSGSGKSTVLRLLFRFYDAQSGSVRVGGQDVRDLTLASLRRQMATVPQDLVLFNDSIFYNIQYGRQGASPEDVRWAARRAAIDTQVRPHLVSRRPCSACEGCAACACLQHAAEVDGCQDLTWTGIMPLKAVQASLSRSKRQPHCQHACPGKLDVHLEQ